MLALAGFRCRCQNNGVSLAGLGGTCTCGVAIAAEDGTWGRSFSAGSWGHSLSWRRIVIWDVLKRLVVGDTPWARLVHWRCIGWSGKCGPVFGRIAGRGFRMGWVAESATRNIALKRVAVSLMRLKRKAHPIPELQNGMRFPRGRIVAAALSSVARYSPRISAVSSSWVSTT